MNIRGVPYYNKLAEFWNLIIDFFEVCPFEIKHLVSRSYKTFFLG